MKWLLLDPCLFFRFVRIPGCLVECGITWNKKAG